MVKYLFLDIEWNAKDGSQNIADWEPILVAAIGTDDKFNILKKFSKRVGLEDISTLTAKTCQLTHAKKEEVSLAKPACEVFKNFSITCSKYEFIVVWTRETYEVYRQEMERFRLSIPKHRVLCLQEILSTIAMDENRNPGFEFSLRQAGISYRHNLLHYSKYDVAYLHELFKSMCEKYEKQTKDESCVVNTGTRKIHRTDCRYARANHTVEMQDTKKLLFSGYKPCQCCFLETDWRRFRWAKSTKEDLKRRKAKKLRLSPLTDENIEKICESFGLTCNFVADMVSISTASGYWRIYLNNKDKVSHVMHANFRVNRSTAFQRGRIKCNQGFHNQNLKMDNFYDVVGYIYCHDKKMMQGKKKRIDFLFDKIERELAE